MPGAHVFLAYSKRAAQMGMDSFVISMPLLSLCRQTSYCLLGVASYPMPALPQVAVFLCAVFGFLSFPWLRRRVEENSFVHVVLRARLAIMFALCVAQCFLGLSLWLLMALLSLAPMVLCAHSATADVHATENARYVSYMGGLLIHIAVLFAPTLTMCCISAFLLVLYLHDGADADNLRLGADSHAGNRGLRASSLFDGCGCPIELYVSCLLVMGLFFISMLPMTPGETVYVGGQSGLSDHIAREVCLLALIAVLALACSATVQGRAKRRLLLTMLTILFMLNAILGFSLPIIWPCSVSALMYAAYVLSTSDNSVHAMEAPSSWGVHARSFLFLLVVPIGYMLAYGFRGAMRGAGMEDAFPPLLSVVVFSILLLPQCCRSVARLTDKAEPIPAGTKAFFDEGMSPREKAVVSLLAEGMSLRTISERLGIAKSTASVYASRAYKKLGVNSKDELSGLLKGAQGTAPQRTDGVQGSLGGALTVVSAGTPFLRCVHQALVVAMLSQGAMPLLTSASIISTGVYPADGIVTAIFLVLGLLCAQIAGEEVAGLSRQRKAGVHLLRGGRPLRVIFFLLIAAAGMTAQNDVGLGIFAHRAPLLISCLPCVASLSYAVFSAIVVPAERSPKWFYLTCALSAAACASMCAAGALEALSSIALLACDAALVLALAYVGDGRLDKEKIDPIPVIPKLSQATGLLIGGCGLMGALLDPMHLTLLGAAGADIVLRTLLWAVSLFVVLGVGAIVMLASRVDMGVSCVILPGLCAVLLGMLAGACASHHAEGLLAEVLYCLEIGAGGFALYSLGQSYQRRLVLSAHIDWEIARNELMMIGLTSRETQIALMVAKGFDTNGIAARLSLGNSTVYTHIQGIYKKMGVHSRSELTDMVMLRYRIAEAYV